MPGHFLGHGGAGGPEEFLTILSVPPETLAEKFRDEVDEMRESLWSDLQSALTQPGYLDDQREFRMPTHWRLALPVRSLAPLLSVFVTGENVSLRPNPSPGGATLSLLNYEVVTVSDFQVGPTGSKLHIWALRRTIREPATE